MPQGPDFRQYLDQALQLGTLTRAQAQKMTRDLVREGQLAQERAQSYVDELVERSRRRTEDLVALVRKEVKAQVSSLGIATREDIARLEARISQATGRTAQAAPAAKPAKPASTSTPAGGSASPTLPLPGEPVKKAAKKTVKKTAAKKATS